MSNARTTYRENEVRGASAVRLVVLLYEQIVEDLRQAARAFEQNNIELRTRRINHAILVIGHLQSPLNFDNGGKVAKDLELFYNTLRQNLVQVQFYPSKNGIAQLITDLIAVREAWVEVGRSEAPSISTESDSVSSPASVPESDHVSMNWQG
jgi:flagellar protein FliS